MITRAAAFALLFGALGPAQAQGPVVLTFANLPGWADDDHAAALAAFNVTCPDLSGEAWEAVCALASRNPPARLFFERFFMPVAITAGSGTAVVFTAYYEPVVRAARSPGRGFAHPVLRAPDAANGRGLTRAEIEDGALAEQGLEIAWLRDPMDLYFLQMQGSGQLDFGDGQRLRVGFAAQNGHPRRSLASVLVGDGHIALHQASARVIRNWALRNPEAATAARRADPSYVFFRELGLGGQSGPSGAMGQPLTPMRSIAVDPRHVPLGSPVWIDPDGRSDLRRLTVAQDTGGAIRGPQRADLFVGSGEAAEDEARRIRTGGRLVVLYPMEIALEMAGL